MFIQNVYAKHFVPGVLDILCRHTNIRTIILKKSQQNRSKQAVLHFVIFSSVLLSI